MKTPKFKTAAAKPMKQEEVGLSEVELGRLANVPGLSEKAISNLRDKFGPGSEEKAKEVVKVELPKETATKYEPLKAIVVVHKNMTWIATDGPNGKNWRCTTNPQRLFSKIEAINADAALEAAVRTKKVAEAYKSLTNPMPKAPFDYRLESALPAQPTKPVDVPTPAA